MVKELARDLAGHRGRIGGMRRYWATPAMLALLLISAEALDPAPAAAGGTLVIADEELSSDDCTSGARAEFEGVDAGATVLGCLAGGARTYLLAADRGAQSADRSLCFYLAPEGYQNEGPCLSVSAHAEQEKTSPLTGRTAPLVMGVGKTPGDGPVYLWGIAASGATSVTIELPARSEQPVSADLLVTRGGGAAGEEMPLVAFAAELPVSTDTCEPLIARARDSAGESLGSDRVSRWDRAYPSAPLALAGSRACTSEPQASLAMATLAAALRTVALRLVLG